MVSMGKKKTSRTKNAKVKALPDLDEHFISEVDDLASREESELRWVNENPHPGTAWDAAFERVRELQFKREARPKHNALRAFHSTLQLARATARFRMIHVEGTSRRHMKPFYGRPPFPESELEAHRREIEQCGRAVVLAWINDDCDFFDDLARVAKLEFGKHRKKPVTIEETIIEQAVELWNDGFCNPSREQVKTKIEKMGIKIRAKDWPGYFKRCKLGFLKSEKGPGHPPKPEPLIRVVIENPKGEFTSHHVTAREGAWLKQRAKWEMEARAEAEANGEEYIPF